MGIDDQLYIFPGISLLNIHNRTLYRSLTDFLYNSKDDENLNDIVILDDKNERINPKKITYVHDLVSFKFDSKQIVDKLLKPFVVSCINNDIEVKEKETILYRELLEPLLEYANSLDIDYEYSYELDKNFYLKLANLDYSINDNLPMIDKITSILRLSVRLSDNNIIIINRAIPLLLEEELLSIEDFCIKNNISLLFIDYLDDSEVVIANNLVIGADFGAYKLQIL